MVAVRHIRASVNAGTPFYRHPHKDHLGSVAAITDAAGAVIERLSAQYSPYRSPAGECFRGCKCVSGSVGFPTGIEDRSKSL